MFCPYCGVKNEDIISFCINCRSFLPDTSGVALKAGDYELQRIISKCEEWKNGSLSKDEFWEFLDELDEHFLKGLDVVNLVPDDMLKGYEEQIVFTISGLTQYLEVVTILRKAVSENAKDKLAPALDLASKANDLLNEALALYIKKTEISDL